MSDRERSDDIGAGALAANGGRTALDIVRELRPDIADSFERFQRVKRAKAQVSDLEEDHIPADLSFLTDFTYEGEHLTPDEITSVTELILHNGVSPRSKNPCVYDKPRVLAALHEATKDAVRQLQINPTKIVRELANIMDGNISDVIHAGPGGIILKDFDTLPRHIKGCIQEIHEVRNAQGVQIKVKLFDKLNAINALTRIMGMNKDRVEVDVTVGLADKLERALERVREPVCIEGGARYEESILNPTEYP